MTKQELIEGLNRIETKREIPVSSLFPKGGVDWEMVHVDADELLLAYIDDEEVSELHSKLAKWYA